MLSGIILNEWSNFLRLLPIACEVWFFPVVSARHCSRVLLFGFYANLGLFFHSGELRSALLNPWAWGWWGCLWISEISLCEALWSLGFSAADFSCLGLLRGTASYPQPGLSTGIRLGPPPGSVAWKLRVMSWGNPGPHLILILSLRDCCPSLFNVFENYWFMYFVCIIIIFLVVLSKRVNLVPIIPSWMEMEVSEMNFKSTFITYYLKFIGVL